MQLHKVTGFTAAELDAAGGACPPSDCDNCGSANQCGLKAMADGGDLGKDWPPGTWDIVAETIRQEAKSLKVGNHPFPQEATNHLVSSCYAILNTKGSVANPNDLVGTMDTVRKMLPAIAAADVLNVVGGVGRTRDVLPLTTPAHVKTLVKRDRPTIVVTLPINPSREQMDALVQTVDMVKKLGQIKEFKQPALAVAFAGAPFPESVPQMLANCHKEVIDFSTGGVVENARIPDPAPAGKAYFFGNSKSLGSLPAGELKAALADTPVDFMRLPLKNQEHEMVGEAVQLIAAHLLEPPR
ncbi:MAG: hypothetical protein AAF654_04345 [Myxococcota bacterium]